VLGLTSWTAYIHETAASTSPPQNPQAFAGREEEGRKVGCAGDSCVTPVGF
jgi:hypothetical protein